MLETETGIWHLYLSVRVPGCTRRPLKRPRVRAWGGSASSSSETIHPPQSSSSPLLSLLSCIPWWPPSSTSSSWTNTMKTAEPHLLWVQRPLTPFYIIAIELFVNKMTKQRQHYQISVQSKTPNRDRLSFMSCVYQCQCHKLSPLSSVSSGLCGDCGVLLHVARQLLRLGKGSVWCETGHWSRWGAAAHLRLQSPDQQVWLCVRVALVRTQHVSGRFAGRRPRHCQWMI